jgi:hypothetical protein
MSTRRIDLEATFHILFLLTVVLTAATVPAADDAGQPALVAGHHDQRTLVKTDLFAAGEDGYATYRIPGIVVTGRGTILAYCAARKDGIGDWADIDVALRRSTDGGRSWQPRRILVDADRATADNPTAIVDRKTGAVHFLYQVNYARCFYMRSDDEGQAFSPAVDITSVFEQFRPEYDWNVIAPGPGHGIQLDNGRLLVPVWLSTGGHKHRRVGDLQRRSRRDLASRRSNRQALRNRPQSQRNPRAAVERRPCDAEHPQRVAALSATDRIQRRRRDSLDRTGLRREPFRAGLYGQSDPGRAAAGRDGQPDLVCQSGQPQQPEGVRLVSCP